MRISECIKPFSEIVSNKFQQRLGVKADIISPYKGAPPGARPILVYSTNTENAVIKIAEICQEYSLGFNLKELTIYERDDDLNDQLNSLGLTATTEIILQTKGLEKSCVVWSTRVQVDTKTETEEFIYTILTRTVSILIIIVFPEIQQSYIDIVKTFKTDRLLIWDDETQTKYNEIIASVAPGDDTDDQDDSADNQREDEDSLDADLGDA